LVNRLYPETERELVYNWSEKWIELIMLINEVTGTDEPPYSPPPPTDLDEIQYQGLRFWFISHQLQFVPLWQDFYQCQGLAPKQNCNNEEIEDPEDMEEYFENPFLFFYKPDNLFQLARQLDLQTGVDIWEPSKYRASTIRPVLIKLGHIMVDFDEWINERACEPR
jgi:hypothetical protein